MLAWPDKQSSTPWKVLTSVFGYAFDRALNRPDRKEDFAFWCHLFGLIAFWERADVDRKRFRHWLDLLPRNLDFTAAK
jgi:hypothetical protein